ncbi:DUF2147 domain-containing protein [Sulfitobacter donghicola]|uniref:Imidazoleglycerol-phosphate dehydratase n=1 Tax=Sulfitobacter donghicola DSW-25 = KCTC 12864 = JCM 14565 TaxID=1300350 RepID=A0A073IHQ7_9RHOB|nr:DUF2147 domain-containing protein [Sulfitobacter donghicola]KEJ89324.1 imidazoleglycerol-phosphate dehydratase [Sulfitobacter donghicola DSW-25 = KCTC 12864 = JCM 14565]KIN69130.1 hypothetical protein Z948_2868 [Sulfitobacter donghicola DSW-25 = KCTC 12864 = JCM 14565]
MKMILAAAVAAVSFAGAAWADPAVGTWKTQVDDGAYAHVKMSKCGAALCGTIARTFNDSGEYKSANLGKKLVWDMAPAGGGSYKNGKIWQPSTGKTFKSKMTLSGSKLKVSGCVGPICKKQTWSRVN